MPTYSEKQALIDKVRTYSPHFTEAALNTLIKEQGWETTVQAVSHALAARAQANGRADAKEFADAGIGYKAAYEFIGAKQKAIDAGVTPQGVDTLVRLLGKARAIRALTNIVTIKAGLKELKLYAGKVGSREYPVMSSPILRSLYGLPAATKSKREVLAGLYGSSQQTTPPTLHSLFGRAADSSQKQMAEIDLLDAINALVEALEVPPKVVDAMTRKFTHQQIFDVLKSALESSGGTVGFDVEVKL